MRIQLQSLTLATLLLSIAACGSVGTTLDGRSITGTSAFLSYALLHSDTHQASVTLGGKTVTVTPTQITWDRGGSLPLPSSWTRIQLNESSRGIDVIVDGAELTTIRPAA